MSSTDGILRLLEIGAELIVRLRGSLGRCVCDTRHPSFVELFDRSVDGMAFIHCALGMSEMSELWRGRGRERLVGGVGESSPPVTEIGGDDEESGGI
jgi:hypothetical protein